MEIAVGDTSTLSDLTYPHAAGDVYRAERTCDGSLIQSTSERHDFQALKVACSIQDMSRNT